MKRTIRSGEYAKELRKAMRLFTDPDTDKPLTRRGLQRLAAESGTPYSYEHFRKVLAGEPVQSEACNAVICSILKLDIDRMWTLAQAEKSIRRFGTMPTRLASPNDPRMREIWDQLPAADREDILRIAEGRVARTRITGDRRQQYVPVQTERRLQAAG